MNLSHANMDVYFQSTIFIVLTVFYGRFPTKQYTKGSISLWKNFHSQERFLKVGTPTHLKLWKHPAWQSSKIAWTGCSPTNLELIGTKSKYLKWAVAVEGFLVRIEVTLRSNKNYVKTMKKKRLCFIIYKI